MRRVHAFVLAAATLAGVAVAWAAGSASLPSTHPPRSQPQPQPQSQPQSQSQSRLDPQPPPQADCRTAAALPDGTARTDPFPAAWPPGPGAVALSRSLGVDVARLELAASGAGPSDAPRARLQLEAWRRRLRATAPAAAGAACMFPARPVRLESVCRQGGQTGPCSLVPAWVFEPVTE